MELFVYLLVSGITAQAGLRLYAYKYPEEYNSAEKETLLMFFHLVCLLWPFVLTAFLIPYGLFEAGSEIRRRVRVAMFNRRHRVRAIPAPEKGGYRTSPKPWLLTPEEEDQIMKLREEHEEKAGA